MFRAHAGILFFVFLSGALKTCVREAKVASAEAKAVAAEAKIVEESAAAAKTAADDLHYLSSAEKQILAEHPATLKTFEESAVLKEENFNWEEFVAEKIEDEMWDKLKEWGFDKADEWYMNRQAANSIAYSQTGDLLCKMLSDKYKKSAVTRETLLGLLQGKPLGDMEITYEKRIRLFYRFSDEYAAWIIAKWMIKSDCDTDQVSELKRIAKERNLSNDRKIIRAINSCQ